MKNKKTISMPKHPKTVERQFAEFMEDMTKKMGKAFQNQVLKKLNKGTVEKFEDAQIGNYANIFNRLAKSSKRKTLKRFDDDRIEKMVKDLFLKANKQNKTSLYQGLGDHLGIDTTTLMLKEGLTPQVNALMIETMEWSKKLRDETLNQFTTNSLRVMSMGGSLTDVTQNFEATLSNRKNASRFIARQQVTNFNSMLSKIRYQKLGIKKAIWVTSRDEKVRASHKDRDGKEFDLSIGLYSSLDGKTLLPGTDYNCRCTYKVIIPEFEELNI